jgi:hypothetical protein
MTLIRAVLAEQLAANESSSAERESFAGHRRRLTELCARGTERTSERTLCVLGAGNANDLELEELAGRYRAIHLVDIDPEALERAYSRESPATRSRLVRHAPVDLSGSLDRLERWKDLKVSPEELTRHAGETAARVAATLGGPFDVVVSACVLTQLQLGLLTALGDRHPLFEALRYTLSATHLTVLSRLTAPGGRALFATDLTSNELAPEVGGTDEAGLPALLERLVAEGRVIGVAVPELIRRMIADSPTLSRELEPTQVLEVWRWQNGPTRTFVVYALEARKLLD